MYGCAARKFVSSSPRSGYARDGVSFDGIMNADFPIPPSGNGGSASPLLPYLRNMLAAVADAERRSLIVALTADFTPGARMDHAESVGKKLQQLEKDKATLEDDLRVTRADLTRARKQLEAEQSRAEELQKVAETSRARLLSSEKEFGTLEARVIELNSALHQAEVKNDQLARALQQAELRTGDTRTFDAIQDRAISLQKELEQERTNREQQRIEKDERVNQLEIQLKQAVAQQGGGEEKALQTLWERLARDKPAPLVEGHLTPNIQSFERLLDAFLEFARFVDKFDKGMGVFLGKYTKYDPSVKVPWDGYAKKDDVTTLVKRVLAPQGGKPAALVRARLQELYRWVHSATVGCDSAIESLGSELHAHLIGPLGTGADANRKIRDYIRADAHLIFAEHMAKLRSLRLAEVWGRG